MNRVLADTLAFLNVVIAVVIILIGALFGNRFITFAGDVVGLAIGAVLGVILAALICGTIAYIALIERHLREIALGGTKSVTRSAAPAASAISERREPSI